MVSNITYRTNASSDIEAHRGGYNNQLHVNEQGDIVITSLLSAIS